MADTPHNRSFRTHAAYISAFRTLAVGGRWVNPDKVLELLADRCLDAYEGKVKPSSGDIDRMAVQSCLHRAWGTEALLCSTSELSIDADLVRIGLAWGAVQTYYACYGGAQAVLVAEGIPRAESHNATQKQVVQLWAQRSFALEPWSLASTDPSDRKACSSGFLNGPGRPLNLNLHAWAALGDGQEWDRAGKALHTTRAEKVKAAFAKARDVKRRARIKDWKDEEAERFEAGRRPRNRPEFPLPQLTQSEKSAQAASVRPVTILDYLYRLRIKANYIDDDLFSQGPEDDGDATAFGVMMEDIVGTTLFAHELRLGKLLGRRWIQGTADRWLTDHQALESRFGLAARLPILAEI